MAALSQAHGEWVRKLRQSRGWTASQLVRKLHEAAQSVGDELPGTESMIVMVYRWEGGRSGIGVRYRRHYCTVFKIPVDRFGDPLILDTLDDSGAYIGSDCADAAWSRSARYRMRATLSQVGDRVRRDQMCFQLGFLCALMATAASRGDVGNPQGAAPGWTAYSEP